jgi:hypothetical protein
LGLNSFKHRKYTMKRLNSSENIRIITVFLAIFCLNEGKTAVLHLFRLIPGPLLSFRAISYLLKC